MKDDPYHNCGEWLNPSCGDANVTADDQTSVICNATYYCQWEIIDATVNSDNTIQITVAAFSVPDCGTSPTGSCSSYPANGQTIAITSLPGILGAEGLWVVSGMVFFYLA